MFLKKLTTNEQISIDYYSNGTVETVKGKVYKLDLLKQALLVKDEKQKSLTIQLSGIKQIY